MGLGWVKLQRSQRAEKNSKGLHVGESNHTAHGQLDAAWENCIFRILAMYEFYTAWVIGLHARKAEVLSISQQDATAPIA